MTKLRLPENKISSIFDGGDKQFIMAFNELEEFSNKYIKYMLKIGGYPKDYPWPIDNLHNWSRWWEYAFAWMHVKELARINKRLRILDIGPALTFFPLFLSQNGFEVTAIDIDSRIKKWADFAFVGLGRHEKRNGKIEFVTGDITHKVLPGRSFDVVTNISVIEHISDKEMAVKEIYRLLRPGGKLINTLDISLDGDSKPLEVKESYDFIQLLENTFGTKLKFDFVHPMDIVTPGRYPKKYTDNQLYVSNFHLARQIWKLIASRLSLKFLLNPNRLDMWTVMGISVQKSSIRR